MSDGNISVQELNFKNMVVLYDGNKISRSVILKHNLIIVFSALSIVALMFAATIGIDKFVSLEQHFWLNIILSCFIAGGVLVCGLLVTYYVDKKITPPHYNVVNWLKKHNKNEVYLGWFNDQYIVLTNETARCQATTENLKKFLESDYTIEDLTQDKSKPVFATIDLTDEIPSVCIANHPQSSEK